ncbi:MAG: hypothetical protein HYS32_03660 [Candidatus Woesearchaeota archaeon]|nr:MAG: hypothetical protein HYS32_03660 [Candidatus Woesearchaeota archaeon]
MRIEGTYAGCGNLSIIFRLRDGNCVKVYRWFVRPDVAKKEYDIFQELKGRGIDVPEPREILEVELSSTQLEQIDNDELKEEFTKDGKTFLALRREFIEGRLMGKSWFGSRDIWERFLELNEAIFQVGYTPYDFIPHNYIVTSNGRVYIIDADKFIKLNPEIIATERRVMLKVPNTHFGRAWFDVKRRCLEFTINSIFGKNPE